MARLIVMGNEKSGSGKSTTAMHLITALVRAGHAVGALDLDLRQKSLFRYLDNRQDYMRRHGLAPPYIPLFAWLTGTKRSPSLRLLASFTQSSE